MFGGTYPKLDQIDGISGASIIKLLQPWQLRIHLTDVHLLKRASKVNIFKLCKGVLCRD